MQTLNHCGWRVYKTGIFCMSVTVAKSCIRRNTLLSPDVNHHAESLMNLWYHGWKTLSRKRAERIQTSEVKSFERRISVSKPDNWFSVCYLQSPPSASLFLPLSLMSVSLFIPSLFVCLCSPHSSTVPVLINRACRQHAEQGNVNVLCQEPAAPHSRLLACLLGFPPASLPCLAVCCPSGPRVCLEVAMHQQGLMSLKGQRFWHGALPSICVTPPNTHAAPAPSAKRDSVIVTLGLLLC